MAKKKAAKKPTGLENTELGTNVKITLGPLSSVENPSYQNQKQVEEESIAGETELTPEGAQPLLSRDRGDSWDYQSDPAIRETLAASTRVETASDELAEELGAYSSTSPILSGGDVDADWERAEAVGEEAVGGSVVTPDQDRVDELGAAAGIVYQDDEPLHTAEKLEKRDRSRWELNSASRRDD